MNNVKIIMLLPIIPGLFGCATIVSDSSNAVSINSSPAQAEFTITNQAGVKVHRGTTPETVVLPTSAGYFSKGSYNVDFAKDGYQSQTTHLESSLNGWYFGNFLFGGIIGLLAVDPATGAMWKLPERTEAVLDKTHDTEQHGFHLHFD